MKNKKPAYEIINDTKTKPMLNVWGEISETHMWLDRSVNPPVQRIVHRNYSTN